MQKLVLPVLELQDALALVDQPKAGHLVDERRGWGVDDLRVDAADFAVILVGAIYVLNGHRFSHDAASLEKKF